MLTTKAKKAATVKLGKNFVFSDAGGSGCVGKLSSH